MQRYHQIKDIIILLEIYLVAVQASFSSMLNSTMVTTTMLTTTMVTKITWTMVTSTMVTSTMVGVREESLGK